MDSAMGLLRGTAVAILLAAASTFESGSEPATPPEASAASLAVPGRLNAYPSAASHGPLVVVAWAATTTEGSTDVYAAISRDGGLSFGAPVRVNDVPGDARISGEQPPRVSLVTRPGRDESIVIVWTAKGPQGSRLLHARSDDGGSTYGRATPVPGSQAPGNRGWESTAVDGSGRVVAAWLDHRELATGSASGAAMSHHDGQAHTGGGDTASIERVGKSVTRQGTYPVLVAGSRVVLAWTSQGSPAVIRLESIRAFD